ncbi:hypothetical protein ACHAXR_005955, partial [Thalassiosira sp. AJA248-18]
MLNESNPKLLVYGGNYAKMGEIKVENLLPFAFPFGMGGPKSKRPTRVSFELCLQRYMRLAMRQFMRGDVILVMHHMYARQLSYKSGVMTCRNNIGGESYGEKFSKISVESLTKAIDENNPSTDPTTKQFFKSISASCKAMGHTPEAAQFARRCCFAMQDYFGLNSVFITISPCDECSFRVRLYAMADKSGRGNDWNKPYSNCGSGECRLPTPGLTQKECIADFTLRKKIRSKYPGACSLEYQSLMNIVVECLFQWDVNEQRSKGKGIFGTTVAFAPADEEQGRKTLHQHVQLWVKEIDSAFRRSLFDENETKRKSARNKLQAYIDKVMTATYGPELIAPTRDGLNISPDKLLTDVNLQTLRDARHEELNKDIRGRVMKSKTNGVALSCQELLNHSLNVWKQHAVDDMYQVTSDIYMPPTSERLDIAAYTYSYNMDGGCHKTNDDVWDLKEIRQLLLTHRFDEHEHTHRHSCFKKG